MIVKIDTDYFFKLNKQLYEYRLIKMKQHRMALKKLKYL